MVQHLDRARLDAARDLATQRLLALRNAGGSWHGRLSSSPLATAAALSALVLAEQHVDDQPQRGQPGHDAWLSGVLFRTELNELVIQSLRWLGDRQNPDGGWADAEGGPSTIAATMMVQTAFQLTAVPAKYAGMVERAEAFLAARGGASGLRRSHYSQALVACVLAAAATAEVIDWREVPRLRIERVLVPPRLRKWIAPAPTGPLAPAVMALGLARAKNWPSRSPLSRMLRQMATPRNVEALAASQGQPGDFHGSPLATSFVVMGLAAARAGNEWIIRRGVEFLLSTVRSDGSWSAESNRSVANTAEASLALDWEFTPTNGTAESQDPMAPPADAEPSLRWLIAQQHGAPGDPSEAGWTASNDVAEAPQPPVTAKVLESLASWQRRWPQAAPSEVQRSATCGVRWLLARQRDDGGWSSGRRGVADADVSSADATADVIRALSAVQSSNRFAAGDADLVPRIIEAIRKGSAFLGVMQDADGSWASHSYGSTSAGEPTNRVMGTARAVGSLAAIGERGDAVVRGADWLAAAQQASGGWGPAPAVRTENGLKRPSVEPAAEPPSTVEETSEAVAALALLAAGDERLRGAALRGVARLCDAAESHWIEQSAPLVLGGDGLWFGEQLLPLVSAVAAFRAAHKVPLGTEPTSEPQVELAARE